MEFKKLNPPDEMCIRSAAHLVGTVLKDEGGTPAPFQVGTGSHTTKALKLMHAYHLMGAHAILKGLIDKSDGNPMNSPALPPQSPPADLPAAGGINPSPMDGANDSGFSGETRATQDTVKHLASAHHLISAVVNPELDPGDMDPTDLPDPYNDPTLYNPSGQITLPQPELDPKNPGGSPMIGTPGWWDGGGGDKSYSKSLKPQNAANLHGALSLIEKVIGPEWSPSGFNPYAGIGPGDGPGVPDTKVPDVGGDPGNMATGPVVPSMTSYDDDMVEIPESWEKFLN